MLKRQVRSRNIWIVIGSLVLGLVTAGVAVAQQPVGPPGPHARGRSLMTAEDREAVAQIFWHRTQERLGLTDQQVTDIHGLLEAQRATARADVRSLIEARRQLQTLVNQPTTDAAAIQTAASHVKELQAKLFDQRLQTQLAVRAKLTPEQWQQWQTLRRGTGHRGWHRGGGFRGGLM